MVIVGLLQISNLSLCCPDLKITMHGNREGNSESDPKVDGIVKRNFLEV